MHAESSLLLRWQTVQREIQSESQRQGRAVPRLVAVSKKQPASAIAELAGYGQRDFGENYVQEAADKMDSLADQRDQLTWHLIGHLQSNKASMAAQRFDWIHTVDRMKLIKPLGAARMAVGPSPLNVLIQVNIDDQDSKHGCHVDEIEPLATAILETPGLQLRGLMTIGKAYENPEDARATFARMFSQFKYLQSRHDLVDTLSMGMSGDFRQAIDEGSTLIRVGAAIFGQRPEKE